MFTSTSLMVCLMLFMLKKYCRITSFINTTGSILGLPVVCEYLSSTRSYMKLKSMYLSIFLNMWSFGTSCSTDTIWTCSVLFFSFLYSITSSIYDIYTQRWLDLNIYCIEKVDEFVFFHLLCLQSETHLGLFHFSYLLKNSLASLSPSIISRLCGQMFSHLPHSMQVSGFTPSFKYSS